MESPPFFLMVYYSRGCQGQYARMLQVKLARLHVVELVAHEVNVERRYNIRRAGDAADFTVLRVSDAGQEVDQAAGDVLVRLLQIHEHGAAITQMVGDLGRELKLLGCDEHDLELAAAVEVDDFVGHAAVAAGGVARRGALGALSPARRPGRRG